VVAEQEVAAEVLPPTPDTVTEELKTDV
jgi:hypothetical protein